MKNLFLCLANVIMLVLGQLLFKYGMNNKSINSITDLFFAILNPVILLAIALYAFTTLLWLFILNKVDLSFAYPIQSLATPILCIASVLFFGEYMSITKIIGIVLIMFGVIIISR